MPGINVTKINGAITENANLADNSVKLQPLSLNPVSEMESLGSNITVAGLDKGSINIPKGTQVPKDKQAPGPPPMSGSNLAGAITGAVIGTAGIVGDSMLEGKRINDKRNSYGILYHDNNTDYKKGRLKSITSMASTGAALGTAINPGLGTAIGAVVGGIGGFFLGKNKAIKEKRLADTNYTNKTVNAKAAFTRKQDAAQLSAFAKVGMKMKIEKDIKSSKKKEVPGIDKNLIPVGNLHARKNSMGDKGIPVVLENGKKVIEIEQDEIIFTKDATDKIEHYVNLYNKNEDDKYLISLGQFLTKEILDNTVDNSEKQILNEV